MEIFHQLKKNVQSKRHFRLVRDAMSFSQGSKDYVMLCLAVEVVKEEKRLDRVLSGVEIMKLWRS